MRTLRPYQRAAIDALYHHLRQGGKGNSLIVAPTGSGKTLINGYLIKEVVETWGARVLLLTHVAELIKQGFDEIKGIWPEADIGIFSAGLKSKDIHNKIIFASIQSMADKVYKLSPPPEVVIIDEAHLIPRKEGTRYVKALTALRAMYPRLVVIGLTATPYRLDSGWLHKGEGAFFDHIVYDIPVQMLIDEGYLSPITTKGGAVKIDTSGVKHVGGEFKAGEIEERSMRVTRGAVDDFVRRGQNRRKWLVFCCGVDHAKQVQEALEALGVASEVILGDTPNRSAIIERFRKRELRALINVNVLTTGFNDPEIDLIVCLRPTESPGLWVQILGRGMRKAPGKTDCLVLDYAGNAVRHGPIDAINPDRKPSKGDGVAPAKECERCGEIIHAALRVCPSCGFEFPAPVVAVQTVATTAPLLKRDIGPEEYTVKSVMYFLHTVKARPLDPPIVKIEYTIGDLLYITEWINPRADYQKAAWVYTKYCQDSGLATIPETAQDFLDAWPIAPSKIWAYKDPETKFWKVTKRSWG